jgi:deoxyribodipyrimidine photo-lyase
MPRMTPAPIIVWFRRDLRIADNPALHYAATQGCPLVPLYLADWGGSDPWAPGSAGLWWLGHSLSRLADSLASKGACLRVVQGEVEQALPRLLRETGAREVVWNRLYEPYSRELDRRIAAVLEREGVGWRAFRAGLLFDPEHHFSRSGRPFRQFTAFWRSCLALPEQPPVPLPEVTHLKGMEAEGKTDTVQATDQAQTWWRPAVAEGHDGLGHRAGAPGWRPPTGGKRPWAPGEAGARARLERFLEREILEYGPMRDLPGIEGTSRLSPHLHFGEISPSQIWHGVRETVRADRLAGTVTSDSSIAFLRQLGWREFAHYLLFHFPHIPGQSFRPEFERFPWQEDPEGLGAWQRGETGYPLVDAAMRQLLAEGWVHNRVRMVAASFLTKDLLIPWREGAAWFWDRLVDADLANNTLGWQWTAGSGPDAAPYFRILNPTLQERRFDSTGAYVNAWIGGALAGDSAQRPPGHPIVDHGEARARALAAFRGIRLAEAPRERGAGQDHSPSRG